MSRFSDKNQKAIDLLRTKCLKLKSMVLCDGRLYEIMRGNFERADRRLVIYKYLKFTHSFLKIRDKNHGQQPCEPPLPADKPRRVDVRLNVVIIRN